MRVRPNRPELDPIAAQVAFVTDDIERDWKRAVRPELSS
jgi:hypothetical protein